ncbi:MAG: type IV pili methyl-accepting chemotaxis transducer N-terminal domain-containing protein [Cyclobacteriaceae bacterium]
MKNLSKTYLIALTVIALVIGISQYLVQDSIRNGSSDSRIINISGRQRMLSQKITKAALAMSIAHEQSDFSSRKKELSKAYELWTKSHEALQYGSEEMQMPEVNNSPKIISLFSEAQVHYDIIKASVEQILAASNIEETQQDSFKSDLQKVLGNEASFLKLMNDITFEYDSESNGRVLALSNTEYILFAIALLLLVMEGLFIFRPAIRRIQAYTKQLLEQGKSLEESLKKEEFLNNQAKSIFANVKQGVFLLDKNLMISDFYSAETESIFNVSNLENFNFLKLMSPRLVKRDLKALEMFTEHLFNPQIRETVVNKLNPVERVEIYPEKGNVEDMDPRHIRISFSRIVLEGEIKQVLVTVLDETENVIMKKQIEESEEKNRIQSTQLLAILNIDPIQLDDFLKQATTSLNSVSERYELHKSDDFMDLITYTFNTVHNVKGNATLIGLNLVEKRLHILEESIVTIKQQIKIEGKDFLKIIYMIAEVLTMLKSMSELQVRITSVYNKSKNGVSMRPNSSLKESLEEGLKKMSIAKGKLVALNFQSNEALIPDSYYEGIKDISIQLMRNSLAHGIESPEVRVGLGKTATATINISIKKNEKGEIVMDYEDDGKGLDVKKIVSRALANRLIEKDEIRNFTSQDITNLIFQADLSTSDETDEFSGRGQGMGLIKSIISQHQGSFKLGYKKNQFFKMRINLPQDEGFVTLDKTA